MEAEKGGAHWGLKSKGGELGGGKQRDWGWDKEEKRSTKKLRLPTMQNVHLKKKSVEGKGGRNRFC